MSIDALKGALPDYAKDLKLNLGSLVSGTSLDQQQLWGTLLATAIASRSEQVLAAIDEEATTFLKPDARQAAKAAAAVMAMNNVYYRFAHLVGVPEYSTMPARLRMNVIANPGVEKLDFELFCLAVSAVNGCGRCLESHERELIDKGASREQIQDAARIAAVVHAVAVTLDAEDHFYAAEAVGS